MIEFMTKTTLKIIKEFENLDLKKDSENKSNSTILKEKEPNKINTISNESIIPINNVNYLMSNNL